MRGRKPKPTHLHVVDGTLHSTRHAARTAEPKAPGGLADAPDWLSEEQNAIWQQAIKDAPAGVLCRIDASALTIWVVAFDTYRRAAAAQHALDTNSKLPFVMKSKQGSVYQSPYLGIMNRQAQIMLKAASELGFTPASRPRLVALDPGQSSRGAAGQAAEAKFFG